MSTFWTNAQDIEQWPNLNVDEVAALLCSYFETVPIDESLQANASGSRSSIIPTYPRSGLDASADLEGMVVDTRNTLLEADVGTSTSYLTGGNYNIPFEQTSACFDTSDFRKNIYGCQDEKPSDTFPARNADRVVTEPISFSNSPNSFLTGGNSQYLNFELESAPSYRLLRDRSPSISAGDQSSNQQYYHGTKFQPHPRTDERFQSMDEPYTYDTVIPEQCPIYSLHKITKGSSHTTFAGPTVSSVPAVPYSPSTIQSNFTPTVSHRRRPLQRPNSMPYTHPHWLRPGAGIQPSTSQTVNRTEVPCPNILGERNFNATGQNRSLVNSTKPRDFSFGEKRWACAGIPRKGWIDPKFLYSTDTGERIFECNLCGSEFETKTALNYHLPKHADNVQLYCNVCKCTHNGKKPFACGLCDLESWHIKNIVGHRRVHFDLRPFKCPHCVATFWKKRLLDKHLKCGFTLY